MLHSENQGENCVFTLECLYLVLVEDSRLAPFWNWPFAWLCIQWIDIQFFVSPFIWLTSIFEASYGTLVAWMSKKTKLGKSELDLATDLAFDLPLI